MSSQSFRRLLSRLFHDLAELRDDPYPGVAVFTDDANLRKFCLVLTPPIGPWKDLSLHFDVQLPENWPSSPPRVRSSVPGINHPNIFESYICCSLLKSSSNTVGSGDYSPALTLRGLFLQFLTFFSCTKIEQEGGSVVTIGDYDTNVYFDEEDISVYLSSTSVWFTASETKMTAMERKWKSSSAPEVVIFSFKNKWRPWTGPLTLLKKDIGTSGQTLHKAQSINPLWRNTLSRIKGWRCTSCPYGSEILPHHQQAAQDNNTITIIGDCTPLLQPPSRCRLELLNDDTLVDIAAHLSSESIISFSGAYTRFREVAASFHILLHREVRCFFLRTTLPQCTLGVGIAFDTRSRVLSSDFEWLSMEAFEGFGVRTSIQKRRFGFFLPLAFNRPHFERVRVDIWKRLAILDSAIREADLLSTRFTKRQRIKQNLASHNVVTVLYRMMNNIVVLLMKSCVETLKKDDLDLESFAPAPAFLHASEKAITSYCHLFHLLMCLSRTTPAILNDATWRLRRFITHPATRKKKETPDLGQMIVLINLVVVLPPIDNLRPMSWDAISTHYLREALTRNVRWVLKEAPELEVIEKGTSDYRLNTTFSKSKTSLRLMMFQITFLNLFIETYASGISRLDENYGFADEKLPERMVREIKEIFLVDTWPKFFSRVRYTHGRSFTKGKFSSILRQTVEDSVTLGYHTPTSRAGMTRLKDRRGALDSSFKFGC